MSKMLALAALTQCFIPAGLIGGTTTTYTTTGVITGTIDGVFATVLSAQTNTATPTTDADGNAFTALAASQVSVFLFGITAAGAIAVRQGSVEDLDDAGVVSKRPQFPAVGDDFLPFGYGVIVNGSTGSAWTFGASNWTATGIVDTFTDIGTMPPRPVAA